MDSDVKGTARTVAEETFSYIDRRHFFSFFSFFFAFLMHRICLRRDLRDYPFLSVRNACRTSGIRLSEDMRRMIIPYVTAICGGSFNSPVEACVGHVEARL